jgi:hypothetical protein
MHNGLQMWLHLVEKFVSFGLGAYKCMNAILAYYETHEDWVLVYFVTHTHHTNVYIYIYMYFVKLSH